VTDDALSARPDLTVAEAQSTATMLGRAACLAFACDVSSTASVNAALAEIELAGLATEADGRYRGVI